MRLAWNQNPRNHAYPDDLRCRALGHAWPAEPEIRWGWIMGHNNFMGDAKERPSPPLILFGEEWPEAQLAERAEYVCGRCGAIRHYTAVAGELLPKSPGLPSFDTERPSLAVSVAVNSGGDA